MNQKVENLNELDSLLVDHFGGNVEEFVVNRSKVTEEIWNILNLKEIMLRLKSSNFGWMRGIRILVFFTII